MDFLENGNDARLKPRLLTALVRERLPDEKTPLGDASRLSAVISLLRLHDLLSESLSPNNNYSEKDFKKISETWKSAVDSWVQRCLSLCADKMPDKCWAGISFIGLTCEMCSDRRFLESYQSWFQALLSNLQPMADSDLVKSASCASLSDLFRRLSRFPHVKKDATSLAGKLVLPVLQLLSQNNTDVVLVGSADLLGVLLTSFPFSLHRHYEKAEATIISILFNNKVNVDVSKKLVYSFAFLPSVKSDEECWNTIMLKVLISINIYLNQAFKGLEEEHRSSEAMLLLVPPGKDPPALLGGESLSTSFALKMAAEIHEVMVPRLSVLMQICCALIAFPPFQVTLPLQSLILLVERVLAVDGSLRDTASIFTSELHQEVLCAELPVLHLYSLELMMVIVQFSGSQLLSYASHIKRILSKYLKRTPLSCLRVKAYSVIQALLIKMGVGMALQLAEDIISSAFEDLGNFIHEKKQEPSNINLATPAPQFVFPTKNKKRKQRPNSKDLENTAVFREESLCITPHMPFSAQTCALETLEALLIVAGSMQAESWRREVDKLLFSVAKNALPAVQANDKKMNSLEWDSSFTRTSFKLAALRALLASLLSYSHTRPPYLSQGLEVFRRGQNDGEKEIADLCARAVLGLEVLIHPRSMPLLDPSATRIFDVDHPSFDSSQKPNFFVDYREPALANDDLAMGSDNLQAIMEEDCVDLAIGDETMENADDGAGVDIPVSEGAGVDIDEVGDREAEASAAEKVETAPSLDGERVLSPPPGQPIVGPSFETRSPSLDSLPDIVDEDPDSD